MTGKAGAGILRARWRSPLWLAFAALAALAAGLALGWGARPAPTAPTPPAGAPALGGRLAALADDDPAAPAPVTLDAPSPTCVRPIPNTATCYVTWSYMYVGLSSSSDYVLSLTVRIDDQVRANMSGFFQSSAYLPNDLFGPGFRVACGAPGAGGDPFLGATYGTLLQARATNGTARLGGSVTCPADLAKLYFPAILKPILP